MKMFRQHPLLNEWRSLPKEHQRDLALDLARDLRSGRFENRLEAALAEAMKFRIATLHRASEEALASGIRASLPFVEPEAFFNLLVRLHFGARASVLSEVYDRLGAEHDGVEVRKEVLEAPLDADKVVAGVPALLASPELPKLRLCLHLMSFACSEAWRPGVEAALAALTGDRVETPQAPEETPAPPPSAGPPPAPAPPETESEPQPETVAEAEETVGGPELPKPPEFTTLDKQLIRAVVASLNEIHGSLGELERNDLVLEVIHLNEARAQSWFHLGFLDSLERRPLAEMQKGDNRERRAWYLSGFLHGAHRLRQERGVLEQLAALDDADRERLLGNGSAGGAQLAEIVVPAQLRSEDPSAALPWLRLYAGTEPEKLVNPVLVWSRRALIDQPPQSVADVLEATLGSLESVREDLAPPDHVFRALRRRLAIAWRRLRRLEEARRLVDELLEEAPSGEERSRLLCDRALITLGIGSLEELRLGHPDTRPALAEALRGVRPQLEEAVACGDGIPVAHYLLGIARLLESKLGDAELKETSASFSRALSAMSVDGPSFWRVTGVQSQCEFLHAVCELRLLEEARAVPAVRELTAALEQRADLPEDLLFEAINIAAGLNVPQVSPLVEKLLGRQPLRALRELDLEEVAERNDALRRLAARFAVEHDEGLRAQEKWKIWSSLLKASLEAHSGRDLETARQALDALERVATNSGLEQPFLGLLANPENWECAWEERDALEARVGVLRRLGRWAQAQEDLERMAWQAIDDRESDAPDWIELYREAGGAPETVDALRRQLEASRAGSEDLDETLTGVVSRPPVRILFVGGNESQERYEAGLREEFVAAHPGSDLDFVFPSWSSNWGKTVDELKPKLDRYSAMVLMRFVRTQLGREMRRMASRYDLPWVACSGHGRESLRRSIESAVRAAWKRERTRAAAK